MSIIKSHSEKLVFGIVLLFCAIFIAYSYSQNREPESIGQLDAHRQKIQTKLEASEVTTQYIFSNEKAKKLSQFETRFKQNLERPAAATVNVSQHVIYPRPMRPQADPATKPGEAPIIHIPTTLGNLTEVAARGDHGCIFIAYKLPQNIKHLEVVRVEIYRGDAADKINTQTPYDIIEYGSEDGVASSEEVIAPPVVAKPEPTTETTVRWRQDKPVAPTVDKDIGKDVKTADELPAELVGIKVYPDHKIDPKKSYYYQLRLIGRMVIAPGVRYETKDPVSTKLLKVTIYDAPKDACNIAASRVDNKLLFAAPFSNVVNAFSPANYEIRLAGTDETNGPVPPPDVPDERLNDFMNYKGTFAVRVWIKEAQTWGEVFLQIGINDKIKGTIPYYATNSNERKYYDFDSGYVMQRIKKVSTTNSVISSTVAILKDTLTDKIEEFLLAPDYPQREKIVKALRELEKRQEAERKAEMERKKKNKPKMPQPVSRP